MIKDMVYTFTMVVTPKAYTLRPHSHIIEILLHPLKCFLDEFIVLHYQWNTRMSLYII